jgi:hypothetical protein
MAQRTGVKANQPQTSTPGNKKGDHAVGERREGEPRAES